MARATAAVATLLATRARRRFGGTNSAGRGRRNAACALHPAQDGRVRGTRRDVREPSCRRLALCVLQVRVQLALASAPVGCAAFSQPPAVPRFPARPAAYSSAAHTPPRPGGGGQSNSVAAEITRGTCATPRLSGPQQRARRSASVHGHVAPSIIEGGFGLGILHDDGRLSGVIFPSRTLSLGVRPWRTLWRRCSRPRRCLSVASDAARGSLVALAQGVPHRGQERGWSGRPPRKRLRRAAIWIASRRVSLRASDLRSQVYPDRPHNPTMAVSINNLLQFP